MTFLSQHVFFSYAFFKLWFFPCVCFVCVSQLLYIEHDYQKKGHLFEQTNWIRMLHLELLDLYVRQKNFHQLKLMTGDKFLIITNEQMSKLLHKESPVKCVPLVLIQYWLKCWVSLWRHIVPSPYPCTDTGYLRWAKSRCPTDGRQ